MKNNLFACITTIQPPTKAVLTLRERLTETGGRLVVAGDRKGPASFELPDCDFLSLDDQLKSGFSLAAKLPVGHYARKNIAYLQAIRAGATCIYETDDDNEPLPSWAPRSATVADARVAAPETKGWMNVYRYFSTDRDIWPRGFPLERLADKPPNVYASAGERFAPIQQGLANGSPDVDAVWRLTQDRPFTFDEAPSVWLGEGQWCPFNTQTTWWWPEAFPLLYVPSHCSFRMCDIWKSFIAQRCLWAMGAGVVFHAAEVFQERNPHNYLRDFEDEIPGYRHNARIARILEGLELLPGAGALGDNLMICCRALVKEEIFPPAELDLLAAWLLDLEGIVPLR